MSGCEPCTIREMNARFADRSDEPLSKAEQSVVADEIDRAVAGMGKWPILPGSFDTRQLQLLTSDRLSTLRRFR